MAVDYNSSIDSGWTALMYASRIGNIEIIKELIKAGADVDAKDSHGKTPLMMMRDLLLKF